MGLLHSFALAVALTAPSGAADTLPAYADLATRSLIERARQRRIAQDSSLNDYTAGLRYRLTLEIGKRRWAKLPVAGVEEQVGRVRWQRPNDVQVEILGRRTAERNDQMRLSTVFDRPWFVPRQADDSLRIVGRDFPAGGAVHPLTAGGDEWYRFAILDSLMVSRPVGPPLQLIRVEVVPRKGGRTLIAGRFWIDAASAEVVRFSFKYIGPVQWIDADEPNKSDSSDARRVNRLLSRFFGLEFDLEYGLQDGFWLPYRQTISGRVQIPFGGGLVIPFAAVTRFNDYDVNSGKAIAFTLPLPDSNLSAGSIRKARRDSLRADRSLDDDRAERRRRRSARSWNVAGTWDDGRFEIVRPSNDSLARYGAWTDTLTLDQRPEDVARVHETTAELERLSGRLPSDITDISPHGFGYERSYDLSRFNRVQGTSLGAGYRLKAGTFGNLYGLVRYGFSDKRVTGRLAWVNDAPGGKFTIAAYRDVLGVDPYALGVGIAHGVDASFAAHDNADFSLRTGGEALFETSVATGVDAVFGARVEKQDSVLSVAKAHINDWLGGSGILGPNPGIDAGTFVGASAGLRGTGFVRWGVTADLFAGVGHATGRLYGDVRYDWGRVAGATIRVKGGVATADPFRQSAFRLGGPETIRGFPYGYETGQAFWSAQLDYTPVKYFLRPVGFIDAGRVGAPGDLFGSVRAAAGIGLSLYSRRFRTNVIRLDFSRPISYGPDKWRFDLVIGAVR